MATISLDPEALRARYAVVLDEAERLKKIIDLLPDIESVSSGRNGRAEMNAKQSLGDLRPVNRELLDKVEQFISSWQHSQFTVPDVLEWLAAHKPGFNAKRERDFVVFALRHYVDGDQKLLKILVKGVGRRPQVYGINGKT